MLTSRIGTFEGLTVLDLFAGSGALALEALSRGAGDAFLAESDPDACRAIATNIRALGASARIVGRDATRLPPAPRPADLIFLDPPYRSALYRPALHSARTAGWIAPHALVSLETAADEDEVTVAGFDNIATRRIGRAVLTFLRPAP